MATTDEGLKVKISADSEDFNKEINKMAEGATNVASKIAHMIAGLALVGFVKHTAEVYRESLERVRRFETAMQAIGIPDEAIESLKEFADAAQEAFGLDNDEILDALATLGRFTGSAKAVDTLKQSLLDMAAATGQSVETAGRLVGSALTRGLQVLRRYGIVATEEQQKMWDSFGDDMNAKADYLNQILQEKFGGAAEKFGDTALGLAERSKRAFEDMQKSLGATVLPVLTGFLNLILQIATAVGGLTNLLIILGTTWAAITIAMATASAIQGKAIDNLLLKYLALGLAKLWAINPILAIIGGAAALAAIAGIIYGLTKGISKITTPTTTGGLQDDVNKAVQNPKNDDRHIENIINIDINQDAMGDYNARTRNINGTQTNIYNSRK